MDIEAELERLKAENLTLQGEAIACQSVVIGLCKEIARTPEGAALVSNAFDYADHFADVGAASLGANQPPAHLQAFLTVLEQMRKAAIGGHGQPKSNI